MALAHRASLLVGDVGEEAMGAWQVDGRRARRLFFLPFIGAFCLVVLWAIHQPAYMLIAREDSILEWLQFSCFLIASIVGFQVGRRLLKRGELPLGLFFLAFGLAFLFVAGEEITWGQRILGLETPADIAARNVQDEINIHNLSGIRALFQAGMILLALYGAIAPWVARARSDDPRLDSLRPLIPPLFLTASFLVAFAGMFLYTVIAPLVDQSIGDITILKFSEYWEACLAAAIAAHVLLTRRVIDMGRGSTVNQRSGLGAGPQ
jgi:hypothetical protein